MLKAKTIAQTQTIQVKQHLIEHGSIDPMQALSLFGIYRLAARIYDLREEGFDIITKRKGGEDGREMATYFFVPSV